MAGTQSCMAHRRRRFCLAFFMGCTINADTVASTGEVEKPVGILSDWYSNESSESNTLSQREEIQPGTSASGPRSEEKVEPRLPMALKAVQHAQKTLGIPRPQGSSASGPPSAKKPQKKLPTRRDKDLAPPGPSVSGPRLRQPPVQPAPKTVSTPKPQGSSASGLRSVQKAKQQVPMTVDKDLAPPGPSASGPQLAKKAGQEAPKTMRQLASWLDARDPPPTSDTECSVTDVSDAGGRTSHSRWGELMRFRLMHGRPGTVALHAHMSMDSATEYHVRFGEEFSRYFTADPHWIKLARVCYCPTVLDGKCIVEVAHAESWSPVSLRARRRSRSRGILRSRRHRRRRHRRPSPRAVVSLDPHDF